jgi:hypothetical protein
MRYRLRTLLIVLTVVCLLLALVGRLPVSASATLNGTQVAVFRASALGGVGLFSDGESVTANFGDQTVLVDAKRIDVVGLRTVQLPVSWAWVEVIRSGNDVQVFVDGKPLN